MTFDTITVLAMAALVVNLSGALFILETLIRRDEGAGRIWALAYLTAMLSTLAYLMWTQMHGTWWVIAVGNGALVTSAGCVWLGARAYNGRRLRLAAAGVAVAALAAMVAVAAAGPVAGGWAGAAWMFAAVVVLSGAGAAESLRGALLRSRTAWVLSFALAGVALYYLSRMTALLVLGPDSALFQDGFGAVTTGFVTVAFTIIAVVTTSVLRAMRAPVRGPVRTSSPGVWDGILSRDEFARALADMCDRARARSEIVGVVAVRIDDLEQFSTAFGSDIARSLSQTWRGGVRRHSPSSAFVGEDGADGLVVGVVVSAPGEARRLAAAVYRGLFDDLDAAGHGVIPVIGVGVGLSDGAGYDPAELTRVARDAAARAALNVDTSVLVGDEA